MLVWVMKDGRRQVQRCRLKLEAHGELELAAGECGFTDHSHPALYRHAATQIHADGVAATTFLQHSCNSVPTPLCIIRAEVISMKKVIQCPCGSVIEGLDDDDVVRKAQDHAKQVHQMELTRDQALAMSRPA